MQDRNRGRQHTPYLATQERDFSGLRYGKITPTDIDGLIDFGNRLFVFFEARLPGIEMDRGQELALERLTDDIENERNHRHAIGIVCEHPNRVGVIDFATSRVLKYRWKAKWLAPQASMNMRDAIDATLKHLHLDYYIGKGS